MLPCKKLRFTEQTAVKERQGGGCPVSWCKAKEIPVRGFSSPHRDFSMTAYLTACRFGYPKAENEGNLKNADFGEERIKNSCGVGCFLTYMELKCFKFIIRHNHYFLSTLDLMLF